MMSGYRAAGNDEDTEAVAKFIVTDVFGNAVIATFASWDHVTRHTEMVGKEDQVKAAIEHPDVVYEGRTPNHKLFTARNITTGFWASSITVAVVQYGKGVGYLNTAYLTTLDPKGNILWKRP
jgi:hypothetical protein